MREPCGGVIVTPDSVYQAVASLRRILGDDPRRPRYIATVPRLGYRLVAKVEAWRDIEPTAALAQRPGSATLLAAAALAIAVAAGGIIAVVKFTHRPPAVRPASPVTIGVAPFLDLTVTMDHEALADEMTEGLADRLSKNPALRSPGFRASIEVKLKGKSKSVAEVARSLGVAYVVDGSVRKDGAKVRVAARLVRAETGLVLWTQTYERPLAELPAIQSSIANSVAEALRAKPRP
jgi:transcriptional activator of cad operon